MPGCPVPKPIFWCNYFKFLRKNVGTKWYKICKLNFYIKIFFGDLDKGVFEFNLTLILSLKIIFLKVT